MTAAAVPHSSTGIGSQQQQGCRTVYVRQGRFFLTLVTVRQVTPCHPASCKVYSTGRFTVREELQWIGQQQAESRCHPYLFLGDHEAAWRQAALGRLQQQLDEPGDSEPLCCSDSAQQAAPEVQQQQAGFSTPSKVASPWWARLLTAFRPRADAAAPPAAASLALDGPVKVSCLQLGLGLKLSKTLSSIARALRFPAGSSFFIKAAGRSARSAAAAGVGDNQQAPSEAPTDARDAAVTGSKAAHAGDAKQKVTAVQIDVIGYPLGMADALAMQVPA